jgi:hypothetical protein
MSDVKYITLESELQVGDKFEDHSPKSSTSSSYKVGSVRIRISNRSFLLLAQNGDPERMSLNDFLLNSGESGIWNLDNEGFGTNGGCGRGGWNGGSFS